MSLKGKHAAVLGVADRDSIAWSIARRLADNGATVTIGYQQKFLSRVRPLLDEDARIAGRRCDVLNPDELAGFFDAYASTGLDVLVHSIAYGPERAFTQPATEVDALDFNETLELSSHSLAKVCRHAKPRLNPWASVMALSFQASERAMPMYGMMGVAKSALESLVRYLSLELGRDRVRVNAISPGPIPTLAALSEIIAFKRDPSALEKLRSPLLRELIAEEKSDDELVFAKRCWARLQEEIAKRSAIPENVDAGDVADTAVFLASDASKKITGQTLRVDCGLSICQII